MQISDTQIKRIIEELDLRHEAPNPSEHLRGSDGALIARLVRKIDALPDREDRIANP